ncbi:MAG: C26 family cysteine hydrolase domain-containing family [Rhodospirillaceae bacterium]|jgi:GMP synthase (glutamine-hydrolysing)|nr:C26 family cysteine hydrolase domain-containing family [Rhodospirillaceae bacterium]MBT6135845.1 C26 family cysteine hydrolase domain-containing family [Rhodospirillaceae bacterium]
MTSRKILLLVHQKTSVAGRVGEILAARGWELDMRRPCVSCELPERAEDYAGVVVFGGPQSANDDHVNGIRDEIDFIPKVLEAGVPFLGICLGGQMLARALGAKVSEHPEQRVEVGYNRIQPTEAGEAYFEHSEFFYQWHREGFELPHGAELLAEGEHFPNQAYIVNDNAIGIQFHPEITWDMINRWTKGAAHRLDRPGAQPKKAHVAGYKMFDEGVQRWTGALFDRLGWVDHTALASAEAAD